MLSKLFAVSPPLSRLPQTENLDLFEAVDLAVQLEMAINEMRINAGEEFAQLFGTIQTVC